jgi:GntR family transcriptional regulator
VDTVEVKRADGGLKHVQVREYVRALVAEAAPGSAAPSERELVARFGVARMTVRQALDVLVTEGLLERVPGRGTFVAHPRRRVGRLSSYTEDMKLRGLLPESQTLVARREQAGPGVARALDISAGDAVIHWKRLRRADQQIICIEDAYLNEILLPGFLQAPLPASLYDELAARGLRPTWAEDTVTADVATPDEADLLGVPAGSAVLRQTRRALAGDAVVEVSRSCYRSDKYTLRVQLGSEA